MSVAEPTDASRNLMHLPTSLRLLTPSQRALSFPPRVAARGSADLPVVRVPNLGSLIRLLHSHNSSTTAVTCDRLFDQSLDLLLNCRRCRRRSSLSALPLPGRALVHEHRITRAGSPKPSRGARSSTTQSRKLFTQHAIRCNQLSTKSPHKVPDVIQDKPGHAKTAGQSHDQQPSTCRSSTRRRRAAGSRSTSSSADRVKCRTQGAERLFSRGPRWLRPRPDGPVRPVPRRPAACRAVPG